MGAWAGQLRTSVDLGTHPVQPTSARQFFHRTLSPLPLIAVVIVVNRSLMKWLALLCIHLHFSPFN
jgi:hypothetical protein